MKPVKQQWVDPPFEKYLTNLNNQSAFRPFKQQEEEKNDLDMSFDIETYINKRKFENSFTLSDITVSSFGTKKEQVKIQSSKDTSVTAQAEQHIKEETRIKPFSIISEVQFSYRPKVKRINDKKIYSRAVSLNFVPYHKQIKTFGVQVQITKESQMIKKQMTNQQLHTEDEGSLERHKVEPPKKSKKEKKYEKIQHKKHQELHENDSNRYSKKEKIQFKNSDEKRSQMEERHPEFPFEGVLRNCSCCGKLISKLCFKCPHIYCNAENCPRKRKKILNEKMLQKMKQQKIKEHYRQRQLYEKMKLEKEGTLNPKFIQLRKHQQLEKKKNPSKNNQKKERKKLVQVTSNEWKTSEQQFNSQLFYDSETDDQKERQKKMSLPFKSRNEQKNVQEKVKLEVFTKKEPDSQRGKEKNTKLTRIQEEDLIKQKKSNKLKKMNSFSMSLYLSSDEDTQKGQNRITRKNETTQVFYDKQSKQKKSSLGFLNKENKKDIKRELYFDSDLESTF